MSYESEKNKMSKHSIWLVVLNLDFCLLEYGTTNNYGTCKATDSEKCYNTFYTCKSKQDFWYELKNKSESENWIKRIAFCDNDANIPHTIVSGNYLGYVVKPYLKDISINLGRINPFGYESGNGVIRLVDVYDDAPELDPYFSTRNGVGGTYFTKLIARYPNLKSRVIEVYRAYWDVSGDVSLNITRKFYGYIDNAELRNGVYEIKVIDVVANIFSGTVPKKHSSKIIIPVGI